MPGESVYAAELKLDDKDHRCHADFLHAEICDTALKTEMRNLKKQHLTKPPLSEEQLALFTLISGDQIPSEHHTPQGYASVRAEHVGEKGGISVCFQGTDGSQGPWSEVSGFALS